MNDNSVAYNKEKKLRDWMRKRQGVLVAYSGGVDSSYLALIATQELGVKAVCVTGVSPSVSGYQLESASRIADTYEFSHRYVKTEEINDPNYRKNAGDRCYFCKSELFSTLVRLRESEYSGAEIIDGTNADDETDYRPGKKAATENEVLSPLSTFGLTKAEIRGLSREHGLETWDKPASPCLSSRIAIGVPVTIERLSRIEKGEEIIRRYGFREFRVRVHDDMARIEIAESEMERPGFLADIRGAAGKIKALGFKFVALELQGFRSGSLNNIGSPAYKSGENRREL